VILVRNEGYSSSLAAATLYEIGLVNATDLIGGFQASQAAGQPTTRSEGRAKLGRPLPRNEEDDLILCAPPRRAGR
jgi:hypothetical protein